MLKPIPKVNSPLPMGKLKFWMTFGNGFYRIERCMENGKA